MKKLNQNGIAHLGMVLVLLIVAAVAFVSYKAVKNRNSQLASTSTVAKTTPVQVIPVVKNTADLNTVETTLNNQNIDGNLNPDSLNDDVTNLL